MNNTTTTLLILAGVGVGGYLLYRASLRPLAPRTGLTISYNQDIQPPGGGIPSSYGTGVTSVTSGSPLPLFPTLTPPPPPLAPLDGWGNYVRSYR